MNFSSLSFRVLLVFLVAGLSETAFGHGSHVSFWLLKYEKPHLESVVLLSPEGLAHFTSADLPESDRERKKLIGEINDFFTIQAEGVTRVKAPEIVRLENGYLRFSTRYQLASNTASLMVRSTFHLQQRGHQTLGRLITDDRQIAFHLDHNNSERNLTNALVQPTKGGLIFGPFGWLVLGVFLLFGLVKVVSNHRRSPDRPHTRGLTPRDKL